VWLSNIPPLKVITLKQERSVKMSLQDEIKNFMAQFLEQVPEDIQKVMQEEAERLAQSGIVEKSLKSGDKAPTFTLSNIFGKDISSQVLLSRGPLVVSFYRGGW
jgi:hypothetical protein